MGWLRRLFGLDAGEDETLARSPGEAAPWHVRFRQCRRTATEWRRPSPAEPFEMRFPIVAPYGDYDLLIAEPPGQIWLVRERIWCGFPDPSCYVFFAFEGDELWCAGDFDNWPRRWTPRPD